MAECAQTEILKVHAGEEKLAQNNLPVSCTISLNLVNEDVFELYCMISQISPKYKIVFFFVDHICKSFITTDEDCFHHYNN